MTTEEIKELIEDVGVSDSIKWLLDIGYIDEALLCIAIKNKAEFKLYKEQLT